MNTIIKKIIMAIVAMFCMVAGARAQCNAAGTTITLQSQTEVDAFAAQYNGCGSLTVDNLWIWASSNGAITDISNINIPVINGNLSISGDFSSDINITTINGNFTISNTSVGAPALHFAQPATITGSAYITDDGIAPVLSNLNIQHIGLECSIGGTMQNLHALDALQDVGLGLTISLDLQSSLGLNSLQSVGDLTINNCMSLTHLVGFDNLTSSNNIVITDNPALLKIEAFGTQHTSITILNTLNTQIYNNPLLQEIKNCNNIVNGTIDISDNPSLINIDAFKNNQGAATITIFNNDALTTISHLLENVATLPNNSVLFINYNDNLQSVSAFHTLTSAGNIILAYNPLLSTLSGFTQLTNIKDLQINTCNTLLDLNGFSGLTTITGLLSIQGCANINNLSALRNNLLFDVLNLENNPNLAYCHVPAVCNHLASGGQATMTGNASGCTSVPIVQAQCTPIATQNTDKNTTNFALQPNPTNSIVSLLLNRLTEMDITITVSNLQGIVVENQKLYKGTATTEFDLSQHPSGLYFITMQTADGERVTQKVVKE